MSENIEKIFEWKKNYGLFGGRVRFIFPEYSQMVFLNSNTLPMMKVCVQNRGFNQDIKSIDCDGHDNPEDNHWIYDNINLRNQTGFHLIEFLQKFDGVDVRLKNRSELYENLKVPNLLHESTKKDSDKINPPHYHHNWRFNNK